MTILPYRSRKQPPHAHQIDDGSTSLGSNGSSASGGKTDATESISMSYSDDEDDASLCYSDASSPATPVPIAIDEGFVIAVPEAPSTTKQNVSRRNLIVKKETSASKENHDAVTKPHDQRVPSIGMGPSALQITCVLKQGWLYKRGTGRDVLGREGFKHRYAYLVLATNQQTSHSIEVPILLIYRNDSATMPSNIIPLDSAVVMVMPNGHADTSLPANERALFNIIQAKRSLFFADDETQTSAVAASRSFATNKEEASAWAVKINTTLIEFEKRKASLLSFSLSLKVSRKLCQTPEGSGTVCSQTEDHWLEI